MLLEQACNYFGWPTADVVLRPPGEGAAACMDSAERRIGAALKRKFPDLNIEIGILSSTPDTAATVWPQAIVCQFRNGASTEAIQEAHRLAWNFSGSAILIVLEPHRLTAWSCCQDPDQPEATRRLCELHDENSTAVDGVGVQGQVRKMLHWVSLVTGEIIRRNPELFPANGRADRLLLKNLRHVRRQLIDSGLTADFCHDLLARVIFTQFLFDRKDSSGNPFFSKALMNRLVTEKVLRKPHSDLASILSSKDEIYSLFRWMDDRFNGDLFPGKEDQDNAERESAWKAEKQAVKESHLKYLSELVSGTIDTTDRQLRLWPQYSFDTIPLEFISSVYEEFLNETRDENKAYYTPPLLVDYVLDAVLPWDGKVWNLRILDPSCGSGIFLVKAFQRLIHRWRRQHDRDPLVSDLKPILANNLVGVDINPDAVRVACFSLYLAMADAIDPRHYVTREKVFPPLRGTQLLRADFFDEQIDGIRTKEDAGAFDLVIGNAPWGDNSIRQTSEIVKKSPDIRQPKKRKSVTKAQAWALAQKWPVANLDVGPLFVAKGLQLVNEAGRVAMVQPAPPWLYQRAKPALALREKLYTEYTVDEITNLSSVRRELFNDVIGPACVMVVGTGTPHPEQELYYFTPKPLRVSSEATELRIEPQDVSRVAHVTASSDPCIWAVLALGGPRDFQLIRRLNGLSSLSKLKLRREVQVRMGFIPGDQSVVIEQFRDFPYLDAEKFPDDAFLHLDRTKIPKWEFPAVNYVYAKVGYEEFKNPQLLIKQSYSALDGRFRAVLTTPADSEWGIICKKTYLAVRDCSADRQHINAACFAYNSCVATYFLFLTSSRIAHYITEVPSRELITVPLPRKVPELSSIKTFEELDAVARKAYSLNEAERLLIDDLLSVSVPDAIRQSPGLARRQTDRKAEYGTGEPDLIAFGQTMTHVLKCTFGREKPIAFTIYHEEDEQRLPVRMVTLHLDWTERDPLTIEAMSVDGLYDHLADFHKNILSRKVRSATGQGLGFQRVAFFVHSHQVNHKRVQNVTIIKPDEYRYWTKSQAMRDADELAASILTAAGRKGTK